MTHMFVDILLTLLRYGAAFLVGYVIGRIVVAKRKTEKGRVIPVIEKTNRNFTYVVTVLIILYLMWGVYLLILDRETGYTSMVTAILFVIIALHRKRIDDPDSRIGRWVGDHFPKWLTFHDLGERRQRSDQ